MNCFTKINIYGCRPRHSIELATVRFVNDLIKYMMDKYKNPITVIIDLSNAYDTLNHDIYFLS